MFWAAVGKLLLVVHLLEAGPRRLEVLLVSQAASVPPQWRSNPSWRCLQKELTAGAEAACVAVQGDEEEEDEEEGAAGEEVELDKTFFNWDGVGYSGVVCSPLDPRTGASRTESKNRETASGRVSSASGT